jgi:hypothetical protein
MRDSWRPQLIWTMIQTDTVSFWPSLKHKMSPPSDACMTDRLCRAVHLSPKKDEIVDFLHAVKDNHTYFDNRTHVFRIASILTAKDVSFFFPYRNAVRLVFFFVPLRSCTSSFRRASITTLHCHTSRAFGATSIPTWLLTTNAQVIFAPVSCFLWTLR